MARLLSTVCVLALAAAPLVAQPPVGRPRVDRQELEQRFRDRLANIMRERLNLNDEQMARLSQLNARFEGQRRAMFSEEFEVRRGLRRALQRDTAAPDAEVSALLERMVQLQRKRVDLLEAEHKELGSFLTPIQQARYFGMQEQLRRQIEEMRARREGSSDRQPVDRFQRRPRRPPGE